MIIQSSAAISVDAELVVPAPMKGKSLEKTGPYLNETQYRQVISFAAPGQVARSFTVLVALGTVHEDAVDFAKNGVTIIDNDNWHVMADSLRRQPSSRKGASNDQIWLFEDLVTMPWQEFSAFCRDLPDAKISEDIQVAQAFPKAGSAENQRRIGAFREPGTDLRSDLVRSVHESGLYSLPLTTRQGMIREIMVHTMSRFGADMSLSWDIRMTHAWDKSGYLEGGEELCPSMDAKWREALSKDPSIISGALEDILEPYFASDFSVLEMEDAHIEIGQTSDDETIYVKAFSGIDMSFTDHAQLRQRLDGMNDEVLMKLWVSLRVLDTDFSRRNRTVFVQEYLNGIRARKEDEWRRETEEELEF